MNWLQPFLAIIVISVLPNILLIFIPTEILKADKHNFFNFQNMMLSFAAAGLLGDVFLHTLPHLLGTHHHEHGHSDPHLSHTTSHVHEEHEHEHHDHDHTEHIEEVTNPNLHHTVAESTHALCPNNDCSWSLHTALGMEKQMVVLLMLLFGFLVFFVGERIAGFNIDSHSHSSHSHSHGHGSSSHDKEKEKEVDSEDEKGKAILRTKTPTSTTVKWFNKLLAPGWLNLVADSMHNFTDGIAIGASFARGGGLALPTFISVIIHEIPHEIGDFSILIRNGLSKYEAIQAQFLTAGAAVIGTVVGVMAQRHEQLEEFLMAFTAGGFLYIATGIFPELCKDKSRGKLQLIGEIVSFVLGVYLMVLVALFE